MDLYIALALFISFLWGLQTVVHKHLLKKFSPATIMLFSTLTYIVLVLVLAATQQQELVADLKKMSWTDVAILLSLSAVTVFGANVIYYYILKQHESSITAALIYSAPVFTLVLAYIFLKERLDVYGLSGVFAIVLGVLLISQNGQMTASRGCPSHLVCP
jgi:transporter family protein